MANVFDVLEERGYIEQSTHPDELREFLGKESVTFYIGFDATASSLTMGHLIPIMSMLHLYKAGHRPIFLLGGGTTMIGDPSGKSEMRQMLTPEIIAANAESFREQFSRFVNFDDGSAILENNANWLLDLNSCGMWGDTSQSIVCFPWKPTNLDLTLALHSWNLAISLPSRTTF